MILPFNPKSPYHAKGLLKSYEQGTVSAEEMQEAINDFNPDLYVELPPDEV